MQYGDEVLRAVQEGRGRPLGLTVSGPGGQRTVTVTPSRTTVRDVFGDEREMWDLGVRPFTPATIGDVIAGYPEAPAGLRGGDAVIALGGKPVSSWEDLAEAIHTRAGQPTPPAIPRGEERLTADDILTHAVDGRNRAPAP